MSHLQQYIQYLKNAGGSVTTDQFDEDWEPIGPQLRLDMQGKRMIIEKDGRIMPNPGVQNNE